MATLEDSQRAANDLHVLNSGDWIIITLIDSLDMEIEVFREDGVRWRDSSTLADSPRPDQARRNQR